MERLPSDSGKNTWDHLDDDDDTGTSPGSNKKSKPAAPISIFKEPTPLSKSTETDNHPYLFDSKEHKEKLEKDTASAETEEETGEAHDDNVENDSFDGEIEKLSPEEVQVVVQHYVAERSKVLEQEIDTAGPDSPTTPIAQADKRLLEALNERTQAEADSSIDDNLEKAATEVISEIEQGEDENHSSVEEEDTPQLTQPVNPPVVHPPHPPTSPASWPTQPGTHHIPPSPPVVPAAQHSPTQPASTRNGGTPPRTMQDGGFGGGFGENTAPNTTTALATPVAEQSIAPEQTKDRLAQGLLIGGVVGYLVGRRRGRIKTEKRLLPVQEKLQKEVAQLEQKIVATEQEVRSVAAKKAILEQAAIKSKAEKPKPIVGTPEKPITAEALATTVTPEKLAPKVELPNLPRLEKATSPQQAKVEQIVQNQSIDHLPLPKLLQAAEAVTIGGKSLARAFEADQIDEAGLRHIVAEFARTGSAERSFKVEVSTHQKRKQSSEHITTILNPEQTVRKKPLTSRSRDNNYVSVRHDLTPLDTAALDVANKSARPTPAKPEQISAPDSSRKSQPTLLLTVLFLVAVMILWLAAR